MATSEFSPLLVVLGAGHPDGQAVSHFCSPTYWLRYTALQSRLPKLYLILKKLQGTSYCNLFF